MGNLSRKTHGLLLVALGVATWALLPLALKPAATVVKPLLLVFARFLAACLLLLPYVVILSLRYKTSVWRAMWGSKGLILLLMLLGFIIPQLCFTWTLGREFVGLVVFIVYSYPCFSVLFARWLLGEKLHPAFFGVFVVLVLGLFLVHGASSSGNALDAPRALSVLVALVVSICWGASTVISKRLLNLDLPSPVVAYARMSAGVLSLFPLFVLVGGFDASEWSGMTQGAWLGLAFAAVVPVSIGLPAYMAGLKRVKVVEASILEAWTPVLAAVLAVPYFGENLDPMQWVGGGLIVLASVLAGMSRTGAPTSASTP